MKVSILMLTHNARKYVKKSIESVYKNTRGIDYELIVLDNASRLPVKLLLQRLKKQGKIDKLILNKENSLFAKGNNIASNYIAEDSDYILLLNSDIEIKEESWLAKLAEICPQGGISSYGAVDCEPVRADGYCMLIDKNSYRRHRLDEAFAWFWSVTKLQAALLREGKRIIAIKNHEEMIHHFGGKSGKAYKNAQGMQTELSEVIKWFHNKRITIVNSLEELTKLSFD
jgi:glycosyltransferase involved in cell wall biosynthesis